MVAAYKNPVLLGIGRVVDSSGPLVRETSVKLKSLSGERRQASLAGSYPGFRVAGQAPVEDAPR